MRTRDMERKILRDGWATHPSTAHVLAQRIVHDPEMRDYYERSGNLGATIDEIEAREGGCG